MDGVRQWLAFLGRRVFSSLIVLLGAATVTFVATHFIGNPVALLVGQQASPEVKLQLLQQLGLDKPLYVQYGSYLANLAHLDFGYSTLTTNPVSSDLAARLPATLELVVVSMIITVGVGVPLGICAAARPGKLIDHAARLVSQLGASMPPFWVGLMLVYAFFFLLHVFPAPLGRLDSSVAPPTAITGFLTIDSLATGNWGALRSAGLQLVLPAVTLAFASLPTIIEIVRNTMASVVASDYMRTARAMGIPRRRLYLRYGFRNVVGPLVTVLAMTLGYMIGNTALVEVVFSWPGIGQYAVTAMANLDFAPVVAVVLVTAAFYIMGYLLAEVLQATVDPRTGVGQ